MTRRQICEAIMKKRMFNESRLNESEAEQDSIEDIVMSYSTWSGTDMKYSVECCAEDLKKAGYSSEQVKEYFDSDGYCTEDSSEGCWDPEFASRIVNSLQSLEDLGIEDGDYYETPSTLDDNDWDETDDPLYGYGEDDLMESKKASSKRISESEDDEDEENEDDWDEEEKDFTTEDAVQEAFPMASPHTIEIITKWYENESAIEDFDSLQEFSGHISSDFLDMFWAGDYDDDEFVEVAKDMINAGYYEADDFPYDEDDED